MSRKDKSSADGEASGKPAKPPKRPLTRRQKRTRKRAMMGGGGFLFILFCVWALSQPLKTTIQFPVCRTFAERQLAFPSTMKVMDVEHPAVANNIGVVASRSGADPDVNRLWQIYYTFIGPFGEVRSNMISCKFAHDQETGQLYIQEADINRQPVDQDKLDAFNKTVPAIIASNPSLIIPAPPTDNLLSLKPADDKDE